jgi:curved DNA-binding protein
MSEDDIFVDYYKILRVDPRCDARALEAAYRELAKTYHPDHAETADVAKFNEIIDAYRAIRDPEHRASYDLRYGQVTGFDFTAADPEYSESIAAISDADAQAKILRFLYQRRRENPQDAGVGRYYVQEMLGCSDESFEFHVWYLKAKEFIETTEQGTLAITINGVDHVILMSRAAVRDPLRIAQSGDRAG